MADKLKSGRTWTVIDKVLDTRQEDQTKLKATVYTESVAPLDSNITKVSGTTQTPDDWTQRFKNITDILTILQNLRFDPNSFLKISDSFIIEAADQTLDYCYIPSGTEAAFKNLTVNVILEVRGFVRIYETLSGACIITGGGIIG